jgi:beta-glucanase (GH16 family)
VDGKLYETRTPADIPGKKWAFNHPFFLIANLAVGGNFPGSPDETTTFPQQMRIDYIRVYQKPDDGKNSDSADSKGKVSVGLNGIVIHGEN